MEPTEPIKLSSRELEVLACMATGAPSKAIGGTLGISKRGADWHLSNIYRKLDVNTKICALNRARELGILD